MAATKFALNDVLALPNAVKIPRLGFGVYQSLDNQCVTSCLAALKAGYRHIDTAQFYGNEKEVGAAVRQSGIKRSELFITTKILTAKGSVDESYQSVLDSVRAIEGDDGAVDLFLIHSATVGTAARKELWLALEKLYEAGKTRSIGVSNYGIGHIEEMKEYAKTWPPHVNQLEV
jgi:diketogulonate reductase-like aldo/keto reductase